LISVSIFNELFKFKIHSNKWTELLYQIVRHDCFIKSYRWHPLRLVFYHNQN
jgi:hypothetical protein